MKYAFFYSTHAISPKGGVKLQAEMWKAGLEKLGHEVEMINSWTGGDWPLFDAIVYFGYAPGTRNHLCDLYKENPRLVLP